MPVYYINLLKKVFILKLNPKLAQSIVDKMMKQIPYNINMMDDHGYIIASGDKKRINTLHVGALDAIDKKRVLPMKSTYESHGFPGVNMPVFFNDQVIGVIGITGDPQIVTPFASLLKVATELLIEQEETNKIVQKQKNALNSFLLQWTQVTNNIEEQDELILKAKKLNIDILKKRTAIAIKNKQINLLQMDPEDFEFSFSPSITIILTKLKSTVIRLVKYCKERKLQIGIGEATENIGISVSQSLKTIKISTIFHRSDYIYYKQVEFIDFLLAKKFPVKNLIDKFKKIDKNESGDNLIKTIAEYVEENGNVVATSKRLFIHRNTLTHRLNRIKEVFGLDPHNVTELFKLYIGWLYFINEESSRKNKFS